MATKDERPATCWQCGGDGEMCQRHARLVAEVVRREGWPSYGRGYENEDDDYPDDAVQRPDPMPMTGCAGSSQPRQVRRERPGSDAPGGVRRPRRKIRAVPA